MIRSTFRKDSGERRLRGLGSYKAPPKVLGWMQTGFPGLGGQGTGSWPRRDPAWVRADGTLSVAERRLQPREQKC